MKIALKPDATERSLLTLCGMPGYLFAERAFDLEQSVGAFTATTTRLKPIRIKREKQIADFEQVYDDPLGAPRTICISSDPNDLKAKYVASILMLQAIRALGTSGSVVWHNLTGSFKDKYRDSPALIKPVKFVVLANHTADASDVKREKLRDLIELFSDIPRIVTVTGDNPINVFNNAGLPISSALWIRSPRCNRVI